MDGFGFAAAFPFLVILAIGVAAWFFRHQIKSWIGSSTPNQRAR